MTIYKELDEDNFIDKDGKIILFSFKNFVKDICDGKNCFICGAHPDEKEFNDEHIIPRWLLKYANLFDMKIILPNTNTVKYGNYTLPCCSECNTLYGKNLEEKVSKLLTLDYTDFKANLTNDNKKILYIWLSFVFFKTHLNDTILRMHLDKRKGTESIASEYDFRWLYHIHALIRSIYTGVHVNDDCMGTFLILRAEDLDTKDKFDYRDINGLNTVLIRIGNICLVSALDDANISNKFIEKHVKKCIDQPMSTIQLREVLTYLSYTNANLDKRPNFHTHYKANLNTYEIGVTKPKSVTMPKFDELRYGQLLHLATFDLLPSIKSNGSTNIEDDILSGKIGFIFDNNGEFHQNFSTKENITKPSNEH